jgi:hypothetical protein
LLGLVIRQLLPSKEVHTMITEFTRPTFLTPGRVDQHRETQGEPLSANAALPNPPETYRQTMQLLEASEDLFSLVFGPMAKTSSYGR